jgi:hypothetical protein
MSNYQMQAWLRRIDELNCNTVEHQSFQEREVWYGLLGINIGQEQNGGSTSFLRPILIIQRFGQHLFWAVPLSTKAPTGSQHHHVFMHEDAQYSALITQLRALDAKRLTRKLYEMDAENFYQIKLHLARYLLRA